MHRLSSEKPKKSWMCAVSAQWKEGEQCSLDSWIIHAHPTYLGHQAETGKPAGDHSVSEKPQGRKPSYSWRVSARRIGRKLHCLNPTSSGCFFHRDAAMVEASCRVEAGVRLNPALKEGIQPRRFLPSRRGLPSLGGIKGANRAPTCVGTIPCVTTGSPTREGKEDLPAGRQTAVVAKGPR